MTRGQQNGSDPHFLELPLEFSGLDPEFLPIVDFHRDSSERRNPSVLPVVPLHRIQELLRVVADAVLEDDFDVFNIGDLP
jgi:hypothetical protein